ncbi:MAG: bifunctional folylpolyglutamate synthase/dihydrofolate synthase [Pseudomonadales bacterium]
MTDSVQPAADRNLADWLEYIERTHPNEIEMGLDRVTSVAQAMGLQAPEAHVITVAGTNGKGSTAIAIEALLLRSGRRVGCTLSPHINHFSERIRIQGQAASDELICHGFAAIEACRGDVPLTYFEFAALAALWCFKQSAVEVVILEIGLGGRLDAFNLVSANTAVITSIGLDHQSFLGHDRASIGAEKAGILRAGQRVCLGPDMPSSVHSRCHELGLEPLAIGASLRISEHANGWTLSCAHLAERWATPLLVQSSFVLSNCALALAAVWPLLSVAEEPAPGLLEDWSAHLSLPGRCQLLIAQGRHWLLDVGHNPLAATQLLAHLRKQFSDRRVVAVFGTLADKDSATMTSLLAGRVSHWVLVPSAGPRGQTSAQLAAQISGLRNVHQAFDLAQGLRLARALTSPLDLVLVWGSFATVAGASMVLETPARGVD